MDPEDLNVKFSKNIPTPASEDDNDEEWREVGPRGTKSCVTRRVEQKGSGTSAKSPLAEMFQGQMRSQVQHSNGEPTATLQPFLTLQLDIQSDKISNVGDAIACNFAEESIDGYMCSKTNQEIEASRSMSLEELPPILVLHLKRFIYDGSSNGCQKLLKNIDFPVDLEINKDILSTNSRNKYPTKQRQYKLFAVVYHNGSEATKGHYVTDIYHTGLSSWLRCDDSILKTISTNLWANNPSFFNNDDPCDYNGVYTDTNSTTHKRIECTIDPVTNTGYITKLDLRHLDLNFELNGKYLFYC